MNEREQGTSVKALEAASEDTVERVARAICRLHARYAPDFRRSDAEVEKFIDWDWKSHQIQARAAIAALSTPTPEAARVAARASLDWYFAGTGSQPLSQYSETTQETLIDHEVCRVSAALTAYWAHILGETKPADLPPDLSQGGSPNG